MHWFRGGGPPFQQFDLWVYLLQYYFCLMLSVFWPWGMRDLSSPDQGLNPQALHWKAKSSPLDHQGGPPPSQFGDTPLGGPLMQPHYLAWGQPFPLTGPTLVVGSPS